MQKVIVTGGTGYVGSRAVEALTKRGVSVVAVDIVTPEKRGITFSSGIEFRQADLREPRQAAEALRDAQVVLHLAADIGSLTYMHDHQAEILTNNAAIDAAVYPALVKNNIPWVIYSSSSMVFQHPPKYPYTEEHVKEIRPPTNVYGFAKLAGEYFCQSYAQQYGLNFTVIRYHNIYGPGEDSKGATPGDIHVIPALLEKIFKGQYPLEILGDPQSTRPFTFVDDAVEATVEIVLRACAEDSIVKNADFNIGNDRYYTILELAELMWKEYGDGRPFAYVSIETKANTALRREVDISKIRTHIGWEPKTSLEEGLKPTAEWIRTRHGTLAK